MIEIRMAFDTQKLAEILESLKNYGFKAVVNIEDEEIKIECR